MSSRGADSAGRVGLRDAEARQAKLLEVLRQPVLKKELFTSPVIIQSVELLRWENSYLCRVRSADGAEGISVAHSSMSRLYPIFLQNLQPFFLGKDARELDLIANDGIEIVQPDSYYFGGLIRSVKVGRMAAAFGKSIVPHMSGGGLGFLYNSHLVSVLPNAGAHHEFKGLNTEAPFECRTSPLKVMRGKIKVPTDPGLGVDIDPDFIRKHRPVTV